MKPVLYIVVPVYNEEVVLPITAPIFTGKIDELVSLGRISEKSRVLFVDDGSRDGSYDIITALSASDERVEGMSLSRNRGHQNALLAGLSEAKDMCDVTVSLDCDGQDDINAVDRMLDEYENGCDIVYGVRSRRDTDSFFKRTTARGFYKLMCSMGAEVIPDHADYRLMSSRAVEALCGFREVNLFLRGMVPMVGFKSTCVYYERRSRVAGKTHYPLCKMISLAFNGITSLSVKPIRLITVIGFAVSVISFIGIIWSVVTMLMGLSVAGWASTVCIICFLGGIQLLSLGVIGEYIGKIYMETKQRPRYIVEKRTYNAKDK